MLLRYVCAPVLAIIFSFSYPQFHTLRYDPLMITGFIVAHIVLAVILLGFVLPRYYDIFIPPARVNEGEKVREEVVRDETIPRNDGVIRNEEVPVEYIKD